MATPTRETPLHTLLQDRNSPDSIILQKIRKHIDTGFLVNSIDSSCRTPLYNAVTSGRRLKVIEYLLYLGAKVNGHGNCRPVLAALANGDIDTADYLMRHGAELDFHDENGNGVLHMAIRSFESERTRYKAVEYLLSHGVDANKLDRSGTSPLHLAIRKRDVRLVEFLVESGADLDAKDGAKQSLLYCAVFHDCYDAAKLLIERGANVNDTDSHGARILNAAVANINMRMIKLLIDSGAVIKSEDDLVKAAEVGSLGVMKLLLDRGARLDECKVAAVGAKVFYAAFTGYNLPMIRYVVDNLLDVSEAKYPGDNGLSPLLFVIQKASNSSSSSRRHQEFYEEVLQLLVKKIQLSATLGWKVHRRYIRGLHMKRVVAYSIICQEELRRMRQTLICGELYDTTYFDVLATTGIDLEKCVCHEEIYSELETDEFEDMFPVYAEDLEAKFLPALRQFRVEEFCDNFCRITNSTLPLNVIYRVCDFFDDIELKNCVRTLLLV